MRRDESVSILLVKCLKLHVVLLPEIPMGIPIESDYIQQMYSVLVKIGVASLFDKFSLMALTLDPIYQTDIFLVGIGDVASTMRTIVLDKTVIPSHPSLFLMPEEPRRNLAFLVVLLVIEDKASSTRTAVAATTSIIVVRLEAIGAGDSGRSRSKDAFLIRLLHKINKVLEVVDSKRPRKKEGNGVHDLDAGR
jgi:hypothetical protein